MEIASNGRWWLETLVQSSWSLRLPAACADYSERAFARQVEEFMIRVKRDFVRIVCLDGCCRETFGIASSWVRG